MTPREFLDEVIEPNVKELLCRPTSLRHAWNAVISLLHAEDYLALARGIKVPQMQSELDQQFPQFEIIRDIGNALKHFERGSGKRKGLSADYTKVSPAAAFSDGTNFSDGTSFADHEDVLWVEFGNESVDVIHLCGTCLAYLKTKT